MTRYLKLAVAFCFLVFTACGSDNPSIDTVEEDTIVEDIGTDTTIHDEGVEDNGRPDVVTDLGYLDTKTPDTNVPDANQPDTNIPDTNVPDTNLPDTNVPDTNVPDTVVPDTNVEDVPAEDIAVEDLIPGDSLEETELPWMCSTDDDCLDYFEEGEVTMCNQAVCDVESGECVIAPVEDGTACSDGDFCTAPDTCVAGECIPGGAVSCDDGDPCTFDECVGDACVNTPDTTILTCGQGPCYREVLACADGVMNTCIPGDPVVESCDGIDNDCDGVVDNNIPEVGAPCVSDLKGPCTLGTVVCSETGLVCTPNVQPTPEKCDKIDNDCDGVVDNDPVSNGMPCAVPGQLGACGIGQTACTNGLITCAQITFPEPEKCDGLDNDCDNDIDENSPGSGVACNTGLLGVCNEGVTSCATGKLTCVQTGFPGMEICDGLDNDCDGIIDPANTIGCTPYFKDADQDGYGSAESVCLCGPVAPYTTTANGDCCDIDSRTKPVGAAPYTTQNNCNSWDYNCDGTVSKQYNYGDGSCGGLVYCKANMVEGWKGAAPNCGETGIYLQDCTFEWGIPPVCAESTKNLTQGCY